MSESTNASQTSLGGMSRGRFLATSASAGVALGLGSPESAHGERVPEGRTPRPPSRQWVIPASVLNTIWTDIIPRVAALQYATGNTMDQLRNQIPVLPWPDPDTDISPMIRTWATALQAGTPGSGYGPVSCEFSVRMQNVLAYLDAAEPNSVPPLRYRGIAGYDFYLSEEGIDIYVPKFDADIADESIRKTLFDLYLRRRTGRPIIGVPNLRTDYMLDAATGASQLEYIPPKMTYPPGNGRPTVECPQTWETNAPLWIARSAAELFAYGESHGEPVQVQRFRRGSWITTEAVDEDLLRDLFVTAYGYSTAEFADIWAGIRHGDAVNAVEAADRDTVDQDRSGECRGETSDEDICGVMTQREWLLEGTVYRAVLAEYPRWLAGKWKDGRDPTGQNYTPAAAVNNPVTVHEELRGDFALLIETHLPPDMTLEFGHDNKPVGTNVITWPSQEVIVTYAGLFLPAPSMPSPTRISIDIISGKAGNPMLTDTSRST